MIITLTGTPYSGKSTIGRLIASRLNYEYIFVGSMLRKISTERNLSITDMNSVTTCDIDKIIDQKTASLANLDNLVVDGRMAWKFLPNSVKVLFTVSIDSASDRAFNGYREDEVYCSKAQATESIKKRMNLEQERFSREYGVDIYNTSHYDIVVDTTSKSIDDILRVLESSLKNIGQAKNNI